MTDADPPRLCQSSRLHRHAHYGRRRTILGIELLESRWMLAGDASAADFLSAGVVAERLMPHSVTGATIITHGFQVSESSGGDSLMPLAQAVRIRSDLENGSDGTSWLLDYDVVPRDGHVLGQFDASQSVLPAPGAVASGHVVLLFDWARESNESSTGWGEAAGDALFNLIVQLGLAVPANKTSVPLHLVGHSFGTAVTSEAVERLAAFGIPVDQVTYLDPHDFDQSLIPVDGDQRLFTLGRPDGYGATVWENVSFTDVLYQTDGVLVIPNGRPIPGAYNRLVNDQVNGFNPHSEVWELYQTTVDDHTSTSGYAYSRVVGDVRPDLRTAANSANWFYSLPATSQDHEYSPDNLTDRGTPLSEEDAVFFQAEPLWNPLSIAFGDFGEWDSANEIPGWLNHGGGGSGEVHCAAVDCYLQLESGKDHHTHNLLYVPASTVALVFDVRRTDRSDDDRLLVQVADEVIGAISLAATDDSLITHAIGVPANLRDKSQMVKFEVVSEDAVVDSQVWIDNIRFGAWQNPAIPTDVSGDRLVVPHDVLLLINEINGPVVSGSDGKLPLPPTNSFGPPFYDVNGDGYVVPSDALHVINQINLEIAAEGESHELVLAAMENFRIGSAEWQTDDANSIQLSQSESARIRTRSGSAAEIPPFVVNADEATTHAETVRRANSAANRVGCHGQKFDRLVTGMSDVDVELAARAELREIHPFDDG